MWKTSTKGERSLALAVGHPGEGVMRLFVLVAAFSLAGCGAQSQAANNADEALAEAERANSRVSDLGSKPNQPLEA